MAIVMEIKDESINQYDERHVYKCHQFDIFVVTDPFVLDGECEVRVKCLIVQRINTFEEFKTSMRATLKIECKL